MLLTLLIESACGCVCVGVDAQVNAAANIARCTLSLY
jgi:hypothetical protein